MEDSIKLCKDCRWSIKCASEYFCDAQNTLPGINLVTGGKVTEYKYVHGFELCELVRFDKEGCGPAGDWYEPSGLKKFTDSLRRCVGRLLHLGSGQR